MRYLVKNKGKWCWVEWNFLPYCANTYNLAQKTKIPKSFSLIYRKIPKYFSPFYRKIPKSFSLIYRKIPKSFGVLSEIPPLKKFDSMQTVFSGAPRVLYQRAFHPTLRAAPGTCVGLALFCTPCDVASRRYSIAGQQQTLLDHAIFIKITMDDTENTL